MTLERTARALFLTATCTFTALVALLFITGSQAQAALNFKDCDPEVDGMKCATLVAPLDHSGAQPGRLTLNIDEYNASKAANGTVVVMPSAPYWSEISVDKDGYPNHRILVVTPRGASRSANLACPSPILEKCATALGEKRHFYTTLDIVEDLELIRQADGLEKMILVGEDYGSILARAYATRYPQNVSKVMLYSYRAFRDPILNGQYAAHPLNVYQEYCEAVRCPPAYRNAATKILMKLTTEGPARARLFSPRGRVLTMSIYATDLSELLASSSSPWTGSESALPTALLQANEGDYAPLAQMVYESQNDSSWAGKEFDSYARAVALASYCEEPRVDTPWALGASAGERRNAVRNLMQAAPTSAWTFGRPSLSQLTRDLEWCTVHWKPNPLRAARSDSDYPTSIPTLLIHGNLDPTTPMSAAQMFATDHTNVTFVQARNIADSMSGGCVQRQVTKFLAGTSRSTTCVMKNETQLKRIPISWEQARPPRISWHQENPPLKAITPAMRVAAAAYLCQGEGSDFFIDPLWSLSRPAVGGLRGGFVRFLNKDGERNDRSMFRRFSCIKGVSITGNLTDVVGAPQGKIAVDGPGRLDGTIEFLSDETVAVIAGERILLSRPLSLA